MLNKIPYFLTLLLIVFPVWAAGGTYSAWQWPLLWLSLLVWLGYGLQRFVFKPAALGKVERDPGFWAALAFLVFLFLQYARSTRVRFYDYSTREWVYSNPTWQFSWLEWIPQQVSQAMPWSFVAEEAFEKIQWFVPVLTILLILRAYWRLEGFRQLLIIGVLVNAIANACLSFVHLAVGWDRMYGSVKFGRDVYGSFGYPNHAAIYFILVLGLALGTLAWAILRYRRDRTWALGLLAGVAAIVALMAAPLSTSRTGQIGTWLMVGCFLLSLGVVLWRRVRWQNLAIASGGVVAIIAIASLVFLAVASPIHMRELRNSTTGLSFSGEIDSRFWQTPVAIDIWMDHPVYGVGGWGYRYLVAEYMPKEDWGKLNTGKANVHNDLAQFLAEFGLLGTTLLIIPFIPALRRILLGLWKRPTDPLSVWADPIRMGCFWGLLILALVAQLDIPLRSPAVFIHGVILLSFFYHDPAQQAFWKPVARDT